MGKVILTNVPVMGGIVNPNVYGLLDCSCKVVPLTAYYVEEVHNGEVVTGGIVAIYG